MDIRMHVTILSPKLNIATIPLSKIQLMMHPLIEQLLFTNRDEESIFCLTKTEHEHSIVLENKYMNSILSHVDKNKLNNCIEVWPTNWIALRTDLGSSGADNESVVNALAKPLYAANISIFYLSTYSSDYCLVEEHNVERAMEVLRNTFKVIIEGEEIFSSSICKIPKQKNEELEQITNKIGINELKLKLLFYNNELQLARVSSEHIHSLSIFLIGCFFYNLDTSIISYIQIEDEISLMGDSRYFKLLSPKLLSLFSFYSETWVPFSVGDQPLGYTESGIVYSISEPLSECDTSIFYMSTFRTDYCLVISSSVENSMQVLKSHFIVENK